MKRFYIFNILLLVFSAFQMGGCKKEWLDAKTMQNLAIPATLQDFQALIDNNSVMNYNSPFLPEIASDGHYVSNAFLSSLSNYRFNAYTWSNLFTYTGVTDWNNSYTRIFYSNLVLEGIEKIQPTNSTDQQIWNNLRGCALFNRANALFELANVWAPAYDSSSAQTDLSIPLRLNSDANVPQTRSTVQQAYDQITNDLLVAKGLLSLTPAFKTRASKPAAFALLARVCLSKRDYTRAGMYADSCLQLYHTLLDYNTLNSLATYPFPLFNNEVIVHVSMGNTAAIGSSALIDSALYASYVSDDLRKQLFFKVNPDATISFRGMFDDKSGTPFAGLAVDEIYLIRAESYARAGNTNAALTDLNTLLKTRWKTNAFVNYTAINANDALTQILKERKKELLIRGIRWEDLRRLNKEPQFAITLTRAYNGINYTLAPNSYQYTFPIPVDVIQLSGIQQNPGW